MVQPRERLFERRQRLTSYASCAPARAGPLEFYEADLECDEVWSFVGRKANKPWVGIALGADTRPIVAFHRSDRGEARARGLWNALPAGCREQATFYADLGVAYRVGAARCCSLTLSCLQKVYLTHSGSKFDGGTGAPSENQSLTASTGILLRHSWGQDQIDLHGPGCDNKREEKIQK